MNKKFLFLFFIFSNLFISFFDFGSNFESNIENPNSSDLYTWNYEEFENLGIYSVGSVSRYHKLYVIKPSYNLSARDVVLDGFRIYYTQNGGSPYTDKDIDITFTIYKFYTDIAIWEDSMNTNFLQLNYTDFFNNSVVVEEITQLYLEFEVTLSTSDSNPDFELGYYIKFEYELGYFDSVVTTLTSMVFNIIPSVLILFIIPSVLYYHFKKNGFILGLIFSTILLGFTGQFDITTSILLVLSELLLIIYIYKKEEND